MDHALIRFPLTIALLATLTAAAVTSVANRGEAAPSALGNLDCGGAAVVNETRDYMPGYAGRATAAIALADVPAAAGSDLVSGFVAVSSHRGGIQYAARVDGRLVAVAMVRQSSLGGWLLDDLLACEDLLQPTSAGVAS